DRSDPSGDGWANSRDKPDGLLRETAEKTEKTGVTSVAPVKIAHVVAHRGLLLRRKLHPTRQDFLLSFDLTGRKSRTAGLLCLFPTGRVPFRGLLGIAHSFTNAHVQMPKLVVSVVPLDLELFERRVDAFHGFFQVFDPFLRS